MKLEKGNKLVMIGDSITDCGRQHPIGEATFQGLGNGYVSIVDALLGAFCPEQEIRVVNTGISGNTVHDLRARWSSDVLDLKPDWLSVLIGINDVWRQFDQPLMVESHVYAAEYEKTLSELVAKTRPLVKGLVLIGPYYIEANVADPMRHMMAEYSQIMHQIADRNDAIFVDTQAVFDEYLLHSDPSTLTADRVHPNLRGHMLIATAFLNSIDFAWRLATTG